MIFLIIFVRNTEHICFRRHGLVERGIEYDNVRYRSEDSFCAAQALYVSGVMHRGKRRNFVDLIDDRFVNEFGMFEEFSTLDYSVPDSIDLALVFNYFRIA